MFLKQFSQGVIALIHFVAIIFVCNASAQTPYTGPIFDAHMHYNVEACDHGGGKTIADCPHPVNDVLARMQRSGVQAVLSNGRPNDGTKALVAARADTDKAGVAVVPFVRLYRNREDYSTWHADASIFTMVQQELAAGAQPTGKPKVAYRGLGEFHLYNAADAKASTAQRLMRLAGEQGLVVLAHTDDAAIDHLMAALPAKPAAGFALIWAHTGIQGADVQRVRALMQRYPALLGELSYRPGLTCAGGQLCPEWKALLTALPTRFVVGSDTWVSQRWSYYEELMRDYRTWLGGLDTYTAGRVAWFNGAELFGLAGSAARGQPAR